MERAAIFGTDAIVRAWLSMNDDTPYFSLWNNGRRLEKATQFNQDDMDGSRAYLESTLLALQETGDNTLYSLRIHPDKEKSYTVNSPVISAFPCRLNAMASPVGGVAALTGGASSIRREIEMEYELRDLRAELAEVRSTIEDMDLSEPMQPAQPTDTLGRIAGLLENPAIMGLVQSVLPYVVKFLPNLMPPVPQYNAMPVAINGVPSDIAQNGGNAAHTVDDVKLNQALDRLEQYCNIDDDMSLLADMAEKDPGTFSFLLSILRKPK